MCEGTKGLRRKVWFSTKSLSPNICYFVAILKFVSIYTLYENLWAKKRAVWVKNSVVWAKKVTHIWYVLHIKQSLMCKFVITRKNNTFVAKIVNTLLTKVFMVILPPLKCCQLLPPCLLIQQISVT